MKNITTTYLRIIERFGAYLGETPIEISADCESFNDEVLVIWTDETLARLAALDLDAEELIGCEEAATEAFWASEEEQCRLVKVRQRLGERAA